MPQIHVRIGCWKSWQLVDLCFVRFHSFFEVGIGGADPARRIKDAALVERRLSALLEHERDSNGEHLSDGFLGGVDVAENEPMADDPETSATVAPDEEALAKLSRDAAEERRRSLRKSAVTALLSVVAVCLVSAGGWVAYRHIEKKKAEAAELQRREAARIAEEKRIEEENARREAEERRWARLAAIASDARRRKAKPSSRL